MITNDNGIKQKSYKKDKYKPQSKKEENPPLAQARGTISLALSKSVVEIGTQSTMKSGRKTLHEFSPHTPKKSRMGTWNECGI
jgi:hypothetical protein